ncbi:MAG: ABC transporter permease [Clostridia bacterium]|nr:ABC transporter permease [Clostridia bacterium]
MAEQTVKTKKAPLFHIVGRGRGQLPMYLAWGIRIGAFLLALLLNAAFVYLVVQVDPLTFYGTMLKGAFGEGYLWATVKGAAKLLCIAVALAPAFKMRFWNIGAEGQVLVGGIAAAIVMFYCTNLPPVVIILLMAVCSIIAGGLWGLLPAVFKAKMDANETLFTLMMNYIAMNLVMYFYNLWRGPKTALGKINLTTHKGWLSSLWEERDANGFLIQGEESLFTNSDFWFVVIIAVITVLMFFYLKYTKQGYEIAVVGESRNTARYAGISVNKVMLRTMIISGAVCGLCGFLVVSSQSNTVSTSMAGGYGFTAIIVAWLSKFNTFTMAGVSVLIVALEKGAAQMANQYGSIGFSPAAADVMIGIMLLLIVGSEFFIHYKVAFRKKTKEVAAV